MGFIKFNKNKINLPQPNEGETLNILIGINVECSSNSISFKGGFVKPKNGVTKTKIKKDKKKEIAKNMTEEISGVKEF